MSSSKLCYIPNIASHFPDEKKKHRNEVSSSWLQTTEPTQASWNRKKCIQCYKGTHRLSQRAERWPCQKPHCRTGSLQIPLLPPLGMGTKLFLLTLSTVLMPWEPPASMPALPDRWALPGAIFLTCWASELIFHISTPDSQGIRQASFGSALVGRQDSSVGNAPDIGNLLSKMCHATGKHDIFSIMLINTRAGLQAWASLVPGTMLIMTIPWLANDSPWSEVGLAERESPGKFIKNTGSQASPPEILIQWVQSRSGDLHFPKPFQPF